MPTQTLPRAEATRIGTIGTFQQTGGRLALTSFPPPQPRRRRWLLSFFLLFVLPTILGIVYFNFIAARQFVTTAVVSLRVGGEPNEGTGGGPNQALGSFGPPASGASLTQSYGVTNYIASMPALDDVVASGLNVREIFSHTGRDILTSLPPNATPETLLRHWRSMVHAEFEVTSGVITLTTRAFTAPESLALAKGVLASTESLLNTVSTRMHEDSLRFAEEEVKTAEERLTESRRKFEEFRASSGVLDVNRSLNVNSQIERRLRQDLMNAEREAEGLRATIGTGSPMYAAANSRANGIRQQLAEMERQNAGTGNDRNGTSNSAIIGRFEALDAEKQIADRRYNQVMDLLQQARLATMKQGTYILTFVRPVEAVEATYPDKLLAPLVVAGAAFLIWAVVMLLYRSLRDHS